jgi:Ca2+-transporting ATPase
VEEGRGIFDNIRRSLFYLLESNASEVLTMFLGILFAGMVAAGGESDLMLPLLAAQLLWINLVTDGPPALALGVEPTAPDAMDRPPRDVRQGILTRQGWLRIGLIGLFMTAGTLLALDAIRFNDLPTAEKHARTLAFTTLVLFQIINALTHRGAEGRSVFYQLGKSPYLLTALGLSLVLHVAVLYIPFLRSAFGTLPLNGQEWLFCAGVAFSLLLVIEIGKLVIRKR